MQLSRILTSSVSLYEIHSFDKLSHLLYHIILINAFNGNERASYRKLNAASYLTAPTNIRIAANTMCQGMLYQY